LGLIGDKEFARFTERQERSQSAQDLLSKTILKPSPAVEARLAAIGSSPLSQALPLAQLLKRPEVGLEDVIAVMPESFLPDLELETAETLEIETKYAGYIELQRQEIARLKKMSGTPIPASLDFRSIAGLSFELREKLSTERPATLADASSIRGITPAALTAVLFHLRQREANHA